MVKEFLSQRDVPYVLKNVTRDADARAEFVRAGYLLPPVTVVDGVPVAGYQPDLLDQLLARGGGDVGPS